MSAAAAATGGGVELDDATKEHIAAAVIQRGWTDFRRRREAAAAAEVGHLAPDDDALDDFGGGGGPGDGVAVDRELTEEEERAMLLARVQSLVDDRRELLGTNAEQQRQLARVMAEARAQQAAEGLPPKEPAAPLAADGEGKYWEYIGRLRQDRSALQTRTSEGETAFRAFQSRNQAVVEEAAALEEQFRAEVTADAERAVYARNNRRLPRPAIETFQAAEAQLSGEVRRVRVQYIRLRNKAERAARLLKKKDAQHDGMHLIDFEQLKIENTNLNERIEERNEDLLKLRKKATTTIHVLTHVKEKLEFVKAENAQLQRRVHELEEMLTVLRDKLTQSKRDRDVFATENQRMKEKTPMIGSDDLLLDYELRKKEIETLRVEVVNLTTQHQELLQWIARHQPAAAEGAAVV